MNQTKAHLVQRAKQMIADRRIAILLVGTHQIAAIEVVDEGTIVSGEDRSGKAFAVETSSLVGVRMGGGIG